MKIRSAPEAETQQYARRVLQAIQTYSTYANPREKFTFNQVSKEVGVRQERRMLDAKIASFGHIQQTSLFNKVARTMGSAQCNSNIDLKL